MNKVAALILVLVMAVAIPAFCAGVDTYCFDQLDGSGQLAYQAMYDCVTHLTAKWNCGSIPQESIHTAFDCLLIDHPEIYWVNSYTYITTYTNNDISGHRVEFTYSMDRDAISVKNHEIEDSLLEIAGAMGSVDPSYETVKALYEYMVRNCSYNALNLDQSLCSVMVDREGVCASFAKSFAFILQCMGIPCTVVFGRLTNSSNVIDTTFGHAWNLVQLNGRWYHVDVTSALTISSKENDLVDYRFLCTTTEEILKTHVIEDVVEIPECTSTDLEFYRYHGLYVTTYSRAAIADCIRRSLELGLAPVVRFSTYHAYKNAIEDLFTGSAVFKVLEEATGRNTGSLNYYLDEDQLLLRLYI